MPQPKSAFTVKYDKIVRELKHDVLISEACLEPLDGQSVKPINIMLYGILGRVGLQYPFVLLTTLI